MSEDVSESVQKKKEEKRENKHHVFQKAIQNTNAGNLLFLRHLPQVQSYSALFTFQTKKNIFNQKEKQNQNSIEKNKMEKKKEKKKNILKKIREISYIHSIVIKCVFHFNFLFTRFLGTI